MKIGTFVFFCFLNLITFIWFYAFSLSALSLFLVAACLCLIESRSHGNAKINALIKRLEMARNPQFEGEVVLDNFRGPSKCDKYGDGVLYWCPDTDKCCTHLATNGNDGNWFCCDLSSVPLLKTLADFENK